MYWLCHQIKNTFGECKQTASFEREQNAQTTKLWTNAENICLVSIACKSQDLVNCVQCLEWS